MRIFNDLNFLIHLLLFCAAFLSAESRKLRSVDKQDTNQLGNSVEYIWSVTTVALGDTAVLHCSFDAIFQQLRNGNIEWYKELTNQRNKKSDKVKRHNDILNNNILAQQRQKSSIVEAGEWELAGATPLASGKKVVVGDGRFRVYRPHNSALSVLIIRRTKKKDAGIYRCNLAGSTTRHRYMILNVTESKIEAQTSPATLRTKIGSDVTLWCNATGYPKPVVYWTREDRNRKLPDGSFQFWGNGLQVKGASEMDSGVYACFLDNFVQPIVSYKFSLMVEENPWNLDGFKMRFDSKQWQPLDSSEPRPVKSKSFLLMCETRGAYKPLPVIRWYKDGKPLKNNKFFYIIEDSPETRSTHASSTLVIMNFLQRFSGNYTCVASNVFRMKKLTFSVKDALNPDEETQPDKSINDSLAHKYQPPFIGSKFGTGNFKLKLESKKHSWNNAQPLPATTATAPATDMEQSHHHNHHHHYHHHRNNQSTSPTNTSHATTDDEDFSEGSGNKIRKSG